jgi:hypothetical protein
LPPATDRNGDIEKVLVRRAEVLTEFPPDPPQRTVSVQEVSDDDARHVIEEALSRNGGFLSQKKGRGYCPQEVSGLQQTTSNGIRQGTDAKHKTGPSRAAAKMSDELSGRNFEPDN